MNPFRNCLKRLEVSPCDDSTDVDGIYSLPSHLSDGAKRLISKMLITNSEERATIPQIFDDPWFKLELPDYLDPTGATQRVPFPVATKGRKSSIEVDEAIVAKVAEVFHFLTPLIPEPWILCRRSCRLSI
jgi:hypothetical protein